jgi:hypothetical protein
VAGVTVNKLEHVVLVKQSISPYVLFYHDGRQIYSSGSDPGTLVAHKLDIGSYTDHASSRAFNGLIHEISVYARALTRSEIWQLFVNTWGKFQGTMLPSVTAAAAAYIPHAIMIG